MATVARPDGVEIHWEAQGRGPVVLIAHQLLWSYPQVYSGLIGDLAEDHSVVIYDPRGCGASSRQGPYDAETDAGDLLAVAEAAGGEAVALAVGYGYNVAVRVAARRPDLIAALVTVQPAAAAMLPRSELRESGVIAASDSVIEMLMQMMSTEPRTALRTVLAATNPDLDEDELRERVARVSEYMLAEAAHGPGRGLDRGRPERARPGARRPAPDHPQRGGAALRGSAGRARRGALSRGAHRAAPGGPISRPELVAARIRRVTSARPSPASARTTPTSARRPLSRSHLGVQPSSSRIAVESRYWRSISPWGTPLPWMSGSTSRPEIAIRRRTISSTDSGSPEPAFQARPW